MTVLSINLIPSIAQDNECGTVVTPSIANKILSLRNSSKNQQNNSQRAVNNVIVKPHIVTNNSGGDGLTTDMNFIKNNLNDAFSDVGFQFIFCSTNIIKETRYHSINSRNTAEETEMASRYNHSNAVNIYFLKNAKTSYAPFPAVIIGLS